VLLVGVGHTNNSSIHLAEYRTDYPGKRSLSTGSSMLIDGQRRWVKYETLDLQDGDFAELGAAFDSTHDIPVHRIGQADVRFIKQRTLVDFAIQWMEENRRKE
jgi:aminoglycoside 3-N-acetyltransferase